MTDLQRELLTIYRQILKPHARMFSGQAKKDKKIIEKAKADLGSPEYKALLFDLYNLAPDAVIWAYNEFMKMRRGDNDMAMVMAFAKLLFEMRRSLPQGDKTGIEAKDMIGHIVTDWSEYATTED